MSLSRVGAVGNDAASSAQLKHAGGGKTARLGSSWGELGCTRGDGGVGSRWGLLSGVDGIVSDTAGVYDTGSGETARLWGFWGKLGGWNRLWGCSAGSSSVLCCFTAVARGPECGRAGERALVDDDVAVMQRGSSWETGDRGTSWVVQIGVGG